MDAFSSQIFELRSDIFTPSPSYCQIDSCQILDALGSSYTGTNLNIIAETQFLMAGHTVVGGFTENIKIQCTLFGSGATAISNLFTVQLADCSNVIQPTATIAAQSFAFSSQSRFLYYNANDLFSNTDTILCPFINCGLSDGNDCSNVGSETWRGVDDIYLTTDWPTITLELVSQGLGYSHDMCLRCNNGQAVADVQSFTVTTGVGPICSTALSHATGAEAVALDFQFETDPMSIAPTTTFVDWNTLFSNNYPEECPITSCFVRQYGCCSYYGWSCRYRSVPIYLLFEETSLTAYVNINNGYDYTYCISCSTGDQSVIIDNFRVSQTPNPCATLDNSRTKIDFEVVYNQDQENVQVYMN